MLGYLGGITLLAMILCRNELKPPVLAVWLLFLVVAVVWTVSTALLSGGVGL